jgi:CheY-like chemotaxis protein
MSSLSRLIEYPDPVDPSRACGSVRECFSDHPDWDMIAVVDAGRAVGLIGRCALHSSDGSRPCAEMMSPVLSVAPDAALRDACGLVLESAEPAPGLAVVEDGLYLGVVPARALLRALADAPRADRDTGSFVELLGAELRAPLEGVQAIAEMLQRQPLSNEADAFTRTIADTCQAMVATLDGALELSRADAGSLPLIAQPVRLRDVMDQIQGRWQPRSAQSGVTLAVAYDGEPDQMAEIDAARLAQVFDGLIGASLALARRGAIEASLQALRAPGGLRLVGRVRDLGGGLSAERLSAAFTSRTAARSGVGLALSVRIVERLGGRIRAESNVGAGATIVFEFSAGEAVAAHEPTGDATATVKRTAHVLVVDDNTTNRMVAEALCEMFDCTSEAVEDGLEAVEAARTGRFDLILMDIRMPRMDGVEATAAIRALPGAAGAVPIIALTANADPDDAKNYLACGMNAVVEKPIKPERLLAAMNAALPEAPGRVAA